MRNAKGQFTDGRPAEYRYPVGSVRIRRRNRNGGEQRAYIKIAEPNTWVLRARYVWEQANGPIPRGKGIHHKDLDKLNDGLENLELTSKAGHLAEHRPQYADAIVSALVAARKERRWSTKSATKRTGRHPANCQCPLHAR